MTLTKALMKALGCRRDPFDLAVPACRLHRMGWDAEAKECKRAQHAAEKLAPLLTSLEPPPYRIVLDEIDNQRTQGWPDFHPEDYCHKCGAHNAPMWCATRDAWMTATAEWSEETGREGICCVACFARMHEEATGKRNVWMVVTVDEWNAR